ncbi:MAG: hypothetical protein HC824_16540 [Synechococcales cyanobacterium RM1_1_8]|nr:hypothetical protein [Synechococcales cyanobacterium RM1_1_8]
MSTSINRLNETQVAQQRFEYGDYAEAILSFQELIEKEPNHKPHYWNLGLALLLKGDEAEAQLCWMAALMDTGSESEPECIQELVEFLREAAEFQFHQKKSSETAWVIRQHLREVAPADMENLLVLTQLSIALNYSVSEYLIGEQGLCELLLEPDVGSFDLALLASTLSAVLKYFADEEPAPSFLRANLKYAQDKVEIRNLLLPVCDDLARKKGKSASAIVLGEIYLSIEPNDLEFLAKMPVWYKKVGSYKQGLTLAERRLELSDSWHEKLFHNISYSTLLGTGGDWEKGHNSFQDYCSSFFLCPEKQNLR